MYFIERKKIEAILSYMEDLLSELKKPAQDSLWDNMALERITQMVIESMIDTGNMMIDGFIMRDPGGYEDIIDILTDEKVIEKTQCESYKQVIGLRKLLVKDYLAIDHEYMYTVLETNMEALNQFSGNIITYLDSELGVANAFTNEA
ncbi:DUF86 domain-containing protein [Virgibacillus halophilus]|uniref:DUF86 domain-containing protein n=1 Tax=Tigheibacillus halophilus TaxID=361280 RepID=A0ABU5C1J8_9BACI|nr:DUF86 domain-containing protein [Virgibacillus halophilus]